MELYHGSYTKVEEPCVLKGQYPRTVLGTGKVQIPYPPDSFLHEGGIGLSHF